MDKETNMAQTKISTNKYVYNRGYYPMYAKLCDDLSLRYKTEECQVLAIPTSLV